MYPVRALTRPVSCTIGKIIIDGGLNTDAMGLENEEFSNEDQCQCMYT